jgi:hypothetical protein
MNRRLHAKRLWIAVALAVPLLNTVTVGVLQAQQSTQKPYGQEGDMPGGPGGGSANNAKLAEASTVARDVERISTGVLVAIVAGVVAGACGIGLVVWLCLAKANRAKTG